MDPRPAPPLDTRRGILMVLWGREPFRKLVLDPGQTVTLGRDERAAQVIADSAMDPLHCQLWWSGRRLEVRDLDSETGTLINGALQPRGIVEQGGFFVAGQTTFQLFVEGWTPATEEPPTAGRLTRLAEVRGALGPVGQLYAVVDAARSERIRWLLQESVDEHHSLYEGPAGRSLDEVAPYLVRFVDRSELLDRLLRGGWGQAWGIYLRSAAHPKEVRRHLRRFLMVQADEPHERLYFRYYDPRVLREFLPEATERQRADLLTGIDRLVLEGPNEEIIAYDGAQPDGSGAPEPTTEPEHVSHP